MTQNTVARILNILDRIKWLSNIMGGPFRALFYLASARKHPDKIGTGSFDSLNFDFRAKDLLALKEVLINEEYRFLDACLKDKEKPTILDVGAHIGTFALWCLSKNKSARIYSIEPDKQTYGILQNNISANDGLAWEALNRAASDKNEILSFIQFKESSMSNRIQDNGTTRVEGITSLKLLEEIGNPKTINLMKVDAEGSEEAFICNYPDMLKKVERLVIELHPNLCNTDRVKKTLESEFPTIQEIRGRISSKPLLYCSR